MVKYSKSQTETGREAAGYKSRYAFVCHSLVSQRLLPVPMVIFCESEAVSFTSPSLCDPRLLVNL
jgi:hypothetical protein